MDAPGATEPEGGVHSEELSDAPPSPQETNSQRNSSAHMHDGSDNGSETQDEDEELEGSADEDEEDDDEPHLKYAHLTKHLCAVYRNGDATSSFLAAADKMV